MGVQQTDKKKIPKADILEEAAKEFSTLEGSLNIKNAEGGAEAWKCQTQHHKVQTPAHLSTFQSDMVQTQLWLRRVKEGIKEWCVKSCYR